MDFYDKLNILESAENVQVLKSFPQHRCTTRFNHCNDVAVYSYRIAKFLKLRIDEESLMRGAMLHDYYLYDTMTAGIPTIDHWMHHPDTALNNLEGLYDLNDKEKGIIRSHMWPLNPVCIPDSKEAWLVCLADKISAVKEVLLLRVLRHGTAAAAAV